MALNSRSFIDRWQRRSGAEPKTPNFLTTKFTKSTKEKLAFVFFVPFVANPYFCGASAYLLHSFAATVT